MVRLLYICDALEHETWLFKARSKAEIKQIADAIGLDVVIDSCRRIDPGIQATVVGPTRRLEAVIESLCEAARQAYENPGRVIPVPGFLGYALEVVRLDDGLVMGLHTPKSFDTGYGGRIADMCLPDGWGEKG